MCAHHGEDAIFPSGVQGGREYCFFVLPKLIYLVMISTCLQGKPQKTLHNNTNQNKWCFSPPYPPVKIFQIKHSSVFCFLFSNCLNGSDYVWLLGVAGFRILSGCTGSWTRKRIKGDVTWLLECVECKVVRGILVCRRLLLVMSLLLKGLLLLEIYFGNYWRRNLTEE